MYGLFGMPPRTIRYKCKCGSVNATPRSFINADSPALCPVCLTATWIVQPERNGQIFPIVASPEAHDWMSRLNAEAGGAKKMAKKILQDKRDSEQLESN